MTPSAVIQDLLLPLGNAKTASQSVFLGDEELSLEHPGCVLMGETG